MREPCHVPLVMVPMVARLASVVRLGSVVVPESLLSKSVLLQYLLVEPCARASVVVPARLVANRLVEKYLLVVPCARASVVVAYQLERESLAFSADWRSVWFPRVPEMEAHAGVRPKEE